MKNLLLLLFLLPLATFAATDKEKISKAEKMAAEAKAFQEMCKLVESKQFQIEINRVHPIEGIDVTRFNPQGKITITDSIAKGHLPYFGRAYSLPYGEGGGIEFDDKMKKVETKITDKRKKKTITFSFSIPGNKDSYQLSIEVMSNGTCSVSLQSNHRNSITYSGSIAPIKE